MKRLEEMKDKELLTEYKSAVIKAFLEEMIKRTYSENLKHESFKQKALCFEREILSRLESKSC